MLRAIAGYFFGGVQNDSPQETVDCETREVNDWLVVNMTDRPGTEVDLDDEVDIGGEEDDILGAVSLLMTLDEHGPREHFFKSDSSDEIDSLTSSKSDESMPEVISSDESDSVSLTRSDASMPEVISSDERDTVSPVKSDASMPEVISSDERDSISPAKSDESFLEDNSCHERDSLSPDKSDESFLEDERDSLSSSRSDESPLEDDAISDERGSSPFSTNCSVVDFHTTEIVESFQTDMSTLSFTSHPFESIFSATDLQRRPNEKYALDLLPFDELGGRMERFMKDYDRVVSSIRHIDPSHLDKFRESNLRVTLIERNSHLPLIPKCFQTTKTIFQLLKEKNAKNKAAKNPLLANVTCHPVYSKTYVNHRNPALPPKTDLLQRIKELEPEQEAKELANKKHISKGQLNRQNKNYIYDSSSKKNRRKNLQRNHSGVNNNRRC